MYGCGMQLWRQFSLQASLLSVAQGNTIKKEMEFRLILITFHIIRDYHHNFDDIVAGCIIGGGI